MARKPNYRFQRQERDRQKAEKRRLRQEAKVAEKAGSEIDPATGEPVIGETTGDEPASADAADSTPDGEPAA